MICRGWTDRTKGYTADFIKFDQGNLYETWNYKQYVKFREMEHCQIITGLWQDIDRITNGYLWRNDGLTIQS